MGCEYVEVSNGSVPMSNDEKAKQIKSLASEFTVFSEVGFKDTQKSLDLSPSHWVEFMQQDLDAGSTWVITESRESGTAGICRGDGELRFGLINEILESPISVEKIVFEAPHKRDRKGVV